MGKHQTIQQYLPSGWIGYTSFLPRTGVEVVLTDGKIILHEKGVMVEVTKISTGERRIYGPEHELFKKQIGGWEK